MSLPFRLALVFVSALGLTGCDSTATPDPDPGITAAGSSGTAEQTLLEARIGFATTLTSSGESFGPADAPTGPEFDLIQIQVARRAAVRVSHAGSRRRQKAPGNRGITGGDNNSIGDVWSPQPRSNDQSASAFRKAGIVMMFPSQRGGNDNPGRREGFLGEVDDILAATDHLAALPYVDTEQIYLGGHSTGGTMVMLVGECSDRYRAVFSLGPVASPLQYGGDFLYCDSNDADEISVRTPALWLHCVKTPMFVFEGADRGNWDAAEMMLERNSNPKIQFFKVPGHDHFSVIAPLAEGSCETDR